MKLGYLDLSGRIDHTVELAPLADARGFSRYWLTEFPPQPSPVTLVGVIAGLTEQIKVGTAAILLALYPPKRTAHDFQLLERLFEGRIDAGSSSSTALEPIVRDDLEGRDLGALAKAYPARFELFLRHLRNTPGSATYDAATAWRDCPEAPPQVWSLGSGQSAQLAARLGTAFGYPLMYKSSVDDPATMHGYQDGFTPSEAQPVPASVLAVAGYCTPTDAEAAAIAQPWSIFAPHVWGSPATVVAKLAALRERYRVDEIIFGDMSQDLAARRATIEGLASEISAGSRPASSRRS